MLQLIIKDFKLAVHPMFYLVPLLGALVLIPEWVYFVAVMYFFFITVPNIFAVAKAQNDIGFSVLMPVRKRDVVNARIIVIVILELIQILVTSLFCAVNLLIYDHQNALLDPNLAFIGFVFIMYGLFNLIFLPMFYKTAWKIGLPTVLATAAALVFASAVEVAVLFLPGAKVLDARQINSAQVILLLAGILLYATMTYLASRISARRFIQLDL